MSVNNSSNFLFGMTLKETKGQVILDAAAVWGLFWAQPVLYWTMSPSVDFSQHFRAKPWQGILGQQRQNPLRKLRSKFTSRVTEIAGTSAKSKWFAQEIQYY